LLRSYKTEMIPTENIWKSRYFCKIIDFKNMFTLWLSVRYRHSLSLPPSLSLSLSLSLTFFSLEVKLNWKVYVRGLWSVRNFELSARWFWHYSTRVRSDPCGEKKNNKIYYSVFVRNSFTSLAKRARGK